jgi:hypothetical protein
MFRLIPCLLVLLMITKRGNRFSYEERVQFYGNPQEIIKTNKLFKKPAMPKPTVTIIGLNGLKVADPVRGFHIKILDARTRTKTTYHLHAAGRIKSREEMRELKTRSDEYVWEEEL